MRKNKLFAAVLASTMLTTSVLSPMGNLMVKATEVVNEESEVASDETEAESAEDVSETEVKSAEVESNETEVEVTETVSNETEVESTEGTSEATEVEKVENNETQILESETINTEMDADNTNLQSEDSSMVNTDLETSNTEILSTETDNTETLDTEMITVTEETTVADANSIIANDETGIPDAELYRWMLVFADSNNDDILTVEEARNLEKLDYSWSTPISSIKGIEYCINLTSVDLHCWKDGQIVDISPLANLTKLTSLELGGNQIVDISLLANLTNLTSLDLSNNPITDISVLANLTNLTELNLGGNCEITDIDINVLRELKNLTNLGLGGTYSKRSPIKDISVLGNLTNLTSLTLTSAQVIDISPLANLALKHNLRIDAYTFSDNNITKIGDFPEYVIYDEEVEIRYLTEADKQRIIKLFGLSEYDGKVICMDSKRQWDSVYKSYPYGDSGYGYDYDILRKDNGDLALGKILREEDNDGRYSFWGSYGNFDNAKLTVSFESNNVWLFCCGNVESSGLTFADKIEKTKIVEPFAKQGTSGAISKSFEREFEMLLSGTLSEQDVESVMDYFGMDSYGGSFALIPTKGSLYKINFEKSSYEKDELTDIQIRYSSLTRNEDGSMEIDYLNNEWYGFKNGKLYGSDYHTYGDEVKFLTKGDIGTDIEECVFYIPAIDENSDEVILITVKLYTLNGSWSGNLMVYNNEKTLEVCNFTEVKEPEEDSEEDTDLENFYQVTLPSDNSVISKDNFTEILEENKTKDVVIQSNNGVSFTFKKGTMSAIDGVTYDFGTELISDLEKAGDMGESITKDNFISRINFNYEGKLPAKASIKFYVGSNLAGKTLHYSHILENGFRHLQSVVVDEEGYIMVEQDHCSDYIVTTEKLDTTENEKPNEEQNPSNPVKPEDTDKPNNNNNSNGGTQSSPATGEKFNFFTYMTMFVFGVFALLVIMQKKVINDINHK